MAIPRRSLIRAALGTAATYLAHPFTLVAAQTGDPTVITGPLDYTAFRSLRWTWFFLANTQTSVAGMARLVGVNKVSSDERCEQFRIRFRPDASLDLPAGLYHVTNWKGHPEFDVYVQPFVNRHGRRYLEADFALLVPESGSNS